MQSTNYNFFKRIVSLIVAVAMVLGCFPTLSFAAEDSTGSSTSDSTSSLYYGRIDNVYFTNDSLSESKIFRTHVVWDASYFEENSLDLTKQITSIKLYLSSSDTFAEADTVSKEVLADTTDIKRFGCNILTDVSGIVTMDKYPGNTKLYAKAVITYKNISDEVLTAEAISSKTYVVPLTGNVVMKPAKEVDTECDYSYTITERSNAYTDVMEPNFHFSCYDIISGEITTNDITFEAYASAGSSFDPENCVKLNSLNNYTGFNSSRDKDNMYFASYTQMLHFYELEEIGVTGNGMGGNSSPFVVRCIQKWNGGQAYYDCVVNEPWQYGHDGGGEGKHGEKTYNTSAADGTPYINHSGTYYEGIDIPTGTLGLSNFVDPFSASELQVEKRENGYYVTCSAGNSSGSVLADFWEDSTQTEQRCSAYLSLVAMNGKDMYNSNVSLNVKGMIYRGGVVDGVTVDSKSEANNNLLLEAGPYQEGETYSFAVYTECYVSRVRDKWGCNWEEWSGSLYYKPKSVLSVTFGGTCNHSYEKSIKCTEDKCVKHCTKCGEYIEQDHRWTDGDTSKCTDSVCPVVCSVCGYESEDTHSYNDFHNCKRCGWEEKTLTQISSGGVPTLTTDGILSINWNHDTTGIGWGNSIARTCAEYGGKAPISVKVEANRGSTFREKDAVLLATTQNATIDCNNGIIYNANVSGASFNSLNYKEGNKITFRVTETLWAGQQNTVSYTVTIGDDCKHENVTPHYDNEKHWEECNDCGDIINEEEHDCKPDKSKCSETVCAGSCKCGYTETHDEHKKAWIDNKDGTHFFGCEYCEYKFEEDSPHTILYRSHDNYTHTAVCSKCSYAEETEDCKMETVCNNDGTHSDKCKFCGFVDNTFDCTFTNKYESDNAGHHYQVCDICNGKDERTKADCGKTYTFMGSHKHKIQCDVCGYLWGKTYANCKEVRTDDESGHHFECSECHNKYDTDHVKMTAKKENYIAPNVFGTGGYDMVVRCRICNSVLSSEHHDLEYKDPQEEKLKEKTKNLISSGAVPVNRGTSAIVDSSSAVDGMELDAVVEGIDELVNEEFAELIEDIDVGEEDVKGYFGEDTKAEDVEIAIEPEVVVDVQKYDADSNTMSVDISAVYSVVLHCGDKEQILLEDKPLEVNNSLKLSVPVPQGFSRPNARITIKHNHNGEIHTYDGYITEDGAYLEFTAEYGLSEFVFMSNDVASVTYSYRTYSFDPNTSKTTYYKREYATKYFDSIQAAFTAAEDYSFEEEVKANLPEGETYSYAYANEITLLADVTVDNALVINSPEGGGIGLDLNGHTFTVTKTGSVSANHIGIDSKVPGTFTSEGTLNINTLATWTADNVNIEGGLNGFLSVDGGNINITGGKFKNVNEYRGTFFNNGGDADINATISGDAEIDGMEFAIYANSEQHNIHLTVSGNTKFKDVLFEVMGSEKVEVPNLILNGGYYDTDPRTWLGGYVQVPEEEVDNDNLDQYYVNRWGSYVLRSTIEESEKSWFTEYYVYDENAFADYVHLGAEVEEYNGQSDWAADSSVYKYRINNSSAPATVKTALKKSIDTANEYYDSIKTDYANIAKTLKAAIDSAASAYNDENEKQENINAAKTALDNALETAKEEVAKGKPIELGDADGNGKVTATDAAMVYKKVITNGEFKLPIEDNEKVPNYMNIVDMDKDGKLTANDVSWILEKARKYDVNIPTK